MMAYFAPLRSRHSQPALQVRVKEYALHVLITGRLSRASEGIHDRAIGVTYHR